MAHWLGYQIKKTASEQSWKGLEKSVTDAYDGFPVIVQEGLKKGKEVALKSLKVVYSKVMKFCSNNEEVLKHLSKMAIKTSRKIVVNTLVKATVRQGVKQAAKQGAKTATTGLLKAVNPVGIGADFAQAGLEYMGMEEAGKKVGMVGNIAAGALLGSVGGPPGAVVGMLGGFLVWGAGEVVGEVIDHAFS